jgi:hypothetical protein
MYQLSVRRFPTLSLTLAILIASAAQAQQSTRESAFEYLPPDVSLVVSLNNLGQSWQEIAQTDLCRQVLAAPQVEKVLKTNQFKELRRGQTFLEGIFGKPLPDLLQEFTENGATLAWRNEQHVAVLFHPTSETFDRLKLSLKSIADLSELGKSKDDALFATKYRDIDAFGINEARIAFAKGWVVLSSNREMGKAIINRILGDKQKRLADEAWLGQAQALAQSLQAGKPPTAIALLHLEKLRSQLKLDADRGVDPGKELFFGGILESIARSPCAALSATIAADTIKISIAAPRIDKGDAKLDYYFGQGEITPAPGAIDLPNRVLSARWHRDVGLFWRMAPQIISDENALAGIAKAESDISTLLGGMVTVSDLFQYLDPNLEFVAVSPMAATAAKPPLIQVPAFGFVGKLRDVEKAKPALRLAFQQVVSFTNLNAGAGKYPPLEVMSERENDTTFITASYIVMGNDDAYDNPAADLYKNFSPTLGLRGDRFVLASHRDLAAQALNPGQHQTSQSSPSGQSENTVIELWPDVLAQVGQLNRESLIAQRMLNTGQSHEAAASDVELALDVLRHFESARLRLLAAEKSLTLDFEAKIRKSVVQK